MSYFAGWPVPSFTSVKASVNRFAVTLATARSLTSAGLVTVAVIVTAALPLGPSLVAVIVAAPAVTPVTKPLPFTTATAGALLAHVTTRPARALPLASLGVAVSCTVWPTPTLAVAGDTATEATGALGRRLTFTTAAPSCPTLVAVIVPVPSATPVTTPLPSTVATAGAILAHVTLCATTLPIESMGVATNCAVCPKSTLAVSGTTTTAATGFNSASSCWILHAATAHAAPSTTTFLSNANRRDNLCLNVIMFTDRANDQCGSAVPRSTKGAQCPPIPPARCCPLRSSVATQG